MPPRIIAIGDIHGCARALALLIEQIDPQPDDLLVTLGDYVDRGSDSRASIQLLIELSERCRLVPILGNHEHAMLAALEGRGSMPFWLGMGGVETLESYGVDQTGEMIPVEHLEFLRSCQLYFETETHFFVHANYNPAVPLARQEKKLLLWRSLAEYTPGPHHSYKVAVVGHTPQRNGLPLYLGHLHCIDTGCCYGKWLTAIDVENGTTWQTNQQGETRIL